MRVALRNIFKGKKKYLAKNDFRGKKCAVQEVGHSEGQMPRSEMRRSTVF